MSWNIMQQKWVRYLYTALHAHLQYFDGLLWPLNPKSDALYASYQKSDALTALYIESHTSTIQKILETVSCKESRETSIYRQTNLCGTESNLAACRNYAFPGQTIVCFHRKLLISQARACIDIKTYTECSTCKVRPFLVTHVWNNTNPLKMKDFQTLDFQAVFCRMRNQTRLRPHSNLKIAKT